MLKEEFFDAVMGSKDAIEIGKVVKVLNFPGVGRNKLLEILRDIGILMKNNIIYQKYIDSGCFRTIEQKYSTPEGEIGISIKTLVYQKGVDFIKENIRRHRPSQTVGKVRGTCLGFFFYRTEKSFVFRTFWLLSGIMDVSKRRDASMMTQNADKKREQIQMFCMDDMVPRNHFLWVIDKAFDWNFIYDLVVDKYSLDNGRPSMDSVMLIKIPFIQYLYCIRSMRQTVKEIEVNVAYRWFLGLEMMDKVPHFSTFGKNYTRRFKDIDLFGQIFSHILQECYKLKLIDPSEVFVDTTHVKARANNKKMQKRIAHEEALFFEDLLKKEINEDCEAHGKRSLKEKDDDDDNKPSGGACGREQKTIKTSTSEPESG